MPRKRNNVTGDFKDNLFLKLFKLRRSLLQDTNHKLLVYKIDYKKYDKDTQYNYLQLPSFKHEVANSSKPSAAGYSLFSKDSLSIGTNLCSTKLTQDVDLLGLLNFTMHSKMWENLDEMEKSLDSLMTVKPEEVVKFLQDILDVLFDILVNNPNPERFDNLVFKCLLRLIEIVSDLKYQHFLSVLDLYINESFASTLAYEWVFAS
jgi:dedicator of cytokinesis protein 1